MNRFGTYIRNRREELREKDSAYSLRKVAGKVGMPASWLSKIETGASPPPSEERINALAEALGEDPDLLMAFAGRISGDLQERISLHPKVFVEVVKWLRDSPDHSILQVVRQVRDGNW